jgi:D-amino peptidase
VKVFVSSDMEGTAGVVDWDQVYDRGPRYEYFCELLTGEVNAAIEGAARAGATEFLVNDAHSRMSNLRPDALAGSARYLSGRHKPLYMMQGLDASFDAVFFVSYHGSMGSASVLSHTYFTQAVAEVAINGVVAGESGVNALAALGHGVPVVLVTGDATTAEETRAFCPSVHAAVVKSSVSRFAADSLHPERARELIREQACLAIASLPSAQQVAIALPATVRVRFKTTDYAELAARISGCERTGPSTAQLVGDDPLALYGDFITIVLLCRGLTE